MKSINLQRTESLLMELIPQALSNLDDEIKLMRFNKKLNAIQMRHYEPSRVICKSVNTNNFKDKENEL